MKHMESCRPVIVQTMVCMATLCFAAIVRGSDHVPYKNDGKGTDSVHSLPTVEARTIRAETFASYGVSVYSSAGSTGARFSRPSEGREQASEETDKNKESDKDAKADPCTGTLDGLIKGNPVYIATGNKLEPELDFSAQGEWPLFLKRTYNHHWIEAEDGGLFGKKWLSNFDYRMSQGSCYARPGQAKCTMTATYGGVYLSVRVHRPDGSQQIYGKAATGTNYVSSGSPLSRLIPQADGGWVLYDADNMVETYSRWGYLLSIRNEAGIGWAFRYGGLNDTQLQEVTHTSGRSVRFIWSGDELREVLDPAGQAYRFTYWNPTGQAKAHVLKTATLPGSPSTTITYHYAGEAGEPATGGLTGKSFNGVRYSWFTYDAKSRATSTEHGNGVDKYTFAYTDNADGTMTVAEVNPLGKQATYVFRNGKVQSTAGIPSNHCVGSYKDVTYDANGHVARVKDFTGNVTDYEYSGNGRLVQKIDAYGTPLARRTTYVWDEGRNKVARITMDGESQVDYAYTAGNRVATVKVTNLSPDGTQGQSRTTAYSYTTHSNGLLATVVVDGPLPADAITYTYNAQGDLVEVKNSLGQAVSYSYYNALGQPGRVTSPNGVLMDYGYDARGRTTLTRAYPEGNAVDTTYAYGASGLLDSVRTADGNVATFHYDTARRLIQEDMSAPAGGNEVKRYFYNTNSQAVRVETGRDN